MREPERNGIVEGANILIISQIKFTRDCDPPHTGKEEKRYKTDAFVAFSSIENRTPLNDSSIQ